MRQCALFHQAGVAVGDDQSVYLSAVCQVSHAGKILSPQLAMALHGSGVAAPTNLGKACQANLTEAGKVSWPEVGQVIGLGLLTALRVLVMVVLASLVWTPLGVWIGLCAHA